MTEAAPKTRSTLAGAPDPTPAVVTYLGELIGKADPGAAGEVLRELARRFGVRGAGVARPARSSAETGPMAWTLDGRATCFPWQDDIGRLRTAAADREPTALEDAGGSWRG